MLEDIRVLCMERLQKMREKHEKWNDGIYPNIEKKLEKLKALHRKTTHNQRAYLSKPKWSASGGKWSATLAGGKGSAFIRGGTCSRRDGTGFGRGETCSRRCGKGFVTGSVSATGVLWCEDMGYVRKKGSGVRTMGGGSSRKQRSNLRMYLGAIRPIGFRISWDPVEGKTMLWFQNSMGLLKHAWPPRIAPEDCRIHARFESQSQLRHEEPSHEDEEPSHEDKEPRHEAEEQV
ncbi:hypothetical protein Tco_0114832 [Tanacetum coccineum]